MKAVVFKELGQPLVLEERPEPEIRADELLVRVKAVGVCGIELQHDVNWALREVWYG